mgnify:CR=1 FL=1
MPREWRVTFEGEEPGSADDFVLTFIDIRDIIGSYIGVKEKVMQILAELIEKHDNYHAIGNIKDIGVPEGEEIELESTWALLGIDKNELRFGFLFITTEQGIMLIGIWPGAYAEAVRENDRLLGGVIAAMLDRPDNWRRVDVILPIKT